MSSTIYGLVAEFDDADAILEAAGKIRDAGYRIVEAYTPFPVHGLAEKIAKEDIRVPWVMFGSGILGLCCGYGLEWSTTSPWVEKMMKGLPVDIVTRAWSYPMNIGGKPFHSWVSFIPPAYEMTILFTAFGAVFGMLLMNGLPRPYHSIFNAKNFDRASQDKFFLCIEADDPKFEYENTWLFLQSLHPADVSEVER
jgi:hypothetical protein